MAEIIQRDGTWAFDGATVRITPGLHRSVPLFRQTYGEIAVPLEAVAGIVYEPERRRGRLRMRLREGADPLLQATGGRLPDAVDPYRLTVDADRSGVAEYLAEEIRHALLLDQIPGAPTVAYLLPGPPVPVSVRSSDGVVSFDGVQVRVDWAETSDRVKRATGPRVLDVGDVVRVEWLPNSGFEDGFLRFVTRETVHSKLPAEKDPYALDLWGNVSRDLLTALVATAVTARLPHPSARAHREPGDRNGNGNADRNGDCHGDGDGGGHGRAHGQGGADRGRWLTASVPSPADHHDVLLRRLRELGELHRDGVLTDEEFARTKAVVLRGF
ncbi:DUF4429 domain-containing protein [Streptomyces sp. ME08-AFT2]|uniref:DUF4429 domain-containing protein n=1 Tax=Streptomyces sp. ME08-AFT2 TaxID=3028683 RepID=UPI0029A5F49E|nr:DUF4429 domain-containing protein [Streptomyces sp. ME08-AFT2]MDX3307770.1 DUF4429 domain-containing protein [Streptomyces sp. ME08-AFT2]